MTGARAGLASADMFTVTSYPLAVAMCVITMICWGSWGNTQKLASKEWRFQLFYWDYCIGIILFTLALGFTLGSMGDTGRGFVEDLGQVDLKWLGSAFVGGVVFNLSNILLVIAIDIAGLAVAFPIGIGLAMVLGVITTYLGDGEGNVPMLSAGVLLVVVAIILDALAYKKLGGVKKGASIKKGIIISVLAGGLMGFFYTFVASSMAKTGADGVLEAGKMTAYSATFVFAIGILLSSFIFNVAIMLKPITGDPVPLMDYFKKGNAKLHLIGMLGGAIWCCGTSLSFISNEAAGAALAYGLGQGATMISAFWGVFIWKEFKGAPKGTNTLLALMFLFFFAGLGILVASKL